MPRLMQAGGEHCFSLWLPKRQSQAGHEPEVSVWLQAVVRHLWEDTPGCSNLRCFLTIFSNS